MKVYTYSEARQNFASLLDEANRDGEVHIRRRDGSSFVIRPDRRRSSPLDVEGVHLDLSATEIVSFVREARRETNRTRS